MPKFFSSFSLQSQAVYEICCIQCMKVGQDISTSCYHAKFGSLYFSNGGRFGLEISCVLKYHC